MNFESEFQGLEQLKKAFDLLPKRVAAKAAAPAVKAGAKIIQAAARAKVPIDTGNLKRSITIKVLSRNRDGMSVTALIGPASESRSKKVGKRGRRWGDGFYGYFVEYGTRRQFSGGKTGKRIQALKSEKRLKEFNQHGGTPPKPFMRPAYDENKGAAQQAMLDVIGNAIEAEAKKFYWGK